MGVSSAEWTISSGAQPITWAVSFCFTCLAIGKLPELTRWTGLLLLAGPAYAALKTSPNFSPDTTLNDVYSRFVIILSAYIAAYCFMPGAGTSATKDLGPSWRGAWKRAYNARGVGLAWENPYLWPSQKSTTVFAQASAEPSKADEPDDIPASRHSLATRGKWSSILIRLCYLTVKSILLAYYYKYRVSATIGTFYPDDVSPEKEAILLRLLEHFFSRGGSPSPVTGREIKIRALLAANKFVPDILYLSNFHDLLAIVFIAAGIDQSWEWPPLFGPLAEAYTMRRFWANFWHRLIYKSFNFHASTLTRTLGIPQGTSFSRILNNLLVFVGSAVMHGVVSDIYGKRCAWGRGTTVFWCVQPVSFVMEGVVQYNWKQYRKSQLSWMSPVVLAAFERVVGYAWVAAWLMWSAPNAAFAFQNCRA